MWDKVPETNDSEREILMSRPAVAASTSLPFELVVSDGEPMDNSRHVLQMYLLIDVVHQLMAERGRKDFFACGNMFVYHSVEQARDVAKGRPYFRGPDFFFVDGVPPRPPRERAAWVSWEEGGRLPDVIVELLSPSTAEIDRTEKRDLYARVFRTSEYYLYDMDAVELEGLRRAGDIYKDMRPSRRGRFRSEVLGMDFGLWHGTFKDREDTWLRLFHPDGRLAPTEQEAEHQRAEAERQRAEAAEAELRRLRARLGKD
jgi:Uma2 family endonuclease